VTSDLVRRFEELTGPDRPVRSTVGDYAVASHPNGTAYAAAGNDRFHVRVAAPPELLSPTPSDFDPEWFAIDPSPADVAFSRGVELLRRTLAAAYARASLGDTGGTPTDAR
jgi:hypothetical protein